MLTAITALLWLLPLPEAHAFCVTTELGYRECFTNLDRSAVERIVSFDASLTDLSFDPPTSIDVVPAFSAFAARTDLDRRTRPFDAAWAAGLAVPNEIQKRTLAGYARLSIDQIRVDLGRAPVGDEVERPFVATVSWTRAGDGRSGRAKVHGRVRQVRVTTPVSLSDERQMQADLNRRLGIQLKIDLMVGDRGLAESETARRQLVREVLFPSVVAYGFARHLTRLFTF